MHPSGHNTNILAKTSLHAREIDRPGHQYFVTLAWLQVAKLKIAIMRILDGRLDVVATHDGIWLDRLELRRGLCQRIPHHRVDSRGTGDFPFLAYE